MIFLKYWVKDINVLVFRNPQNSLKIHGIVNTRGDVLTLLSTRIWRCIWHDLVPYFEEGKCMNVLVTTSLSIFAAQWDATAVRDNNHSYLGHLRQA